MVDAEVIYANLIDTSIYLNPDEKQAILAEELDSYLARLKADDDAIFAPVQELVSQPEVEGNDNNNREDSKQDVISVENQQQLIQDDAQSEREWVELAG